LAGKRRLGTGDGIDVFFAPAENPGFAVYILEGYGQVFMLKVGFPLVPPPLKGNSSEEESAGNFKLEEKPGGTLWSSGRRKE